MDRVIELIASLPALVLAHPLLLAPAVLLAAAGYVAVLRVMLRREDRRERQRNGNRYGA